LCHDWKKYERAKIYLYITKKLYNILVMDSLEANLNLKMAALADPTRRALIKRLRFGEAGVMELAEPFAMSQPAISKHLKVLEKAGLIIRRRDAQKRPCRLAPDGFTEIAQWMNDYRTLWEQRLDRLETYLSTLKENEK
jgi:DNA-binding transcriptional ArsR family regulator